MITLRVWPPIVAKLEHMEGPGLPEKITVSEPGICTSCGVATDKFVNRWGRTACVVCDAKRAVQ